MYEGGNSGIEYLKTMVSNNTLFDRNDFCETPSKYIKYLCNVILAIQSVYHSTKDKGKDVIYYWKVLLDQWCYARKIDPCLKRKKKVD